MIAQDIEKILLSEEEIENRCVELAHQIEADYKESGDTPIVVGLLKGSVPFMAELIKRFEFPCEIDFMSVSSYDGTESIGDVRILKDMDLSCKNRSILVVEDIIEDDKLLIMNLYSKYKAIYQYFDDWIVIKTDENYEDITEIIAKKKEKHHIETNVW